MGTTAMLPTNQDFVLGKDMTSTNETLVTYYHIWHSPFFWSQGSIGLRSPTVHHDRTTLQQDGVDFCSRLCICQSVDQQYAPSHFPWKLAQRIGAIPWVDP